MSLQIAILYARCEKSDRRSRPHGSSRTSSRRRGHETTLVDAMEQGLPLLDPMYKENEKGKAPAVRSGWPISTAPPMPLSF
jgi:hypothetical protein